MIRTLLLSAAALTICASSFAQQPLLKAEAYYQKSGGSYILKDSAEFIHGSGHTSVAAQKERSYLLDLRLTYKYDTGYWYLQSTGPIKKQARFIGIYDGNDSLIEYQDDLYDAVNNTFNKNYRHRYIYNSNHQIDSIQGEEWKNVSAVYANERMWKYNYDGNNMLSEIVLTMWNGTSNIWENGSIDSFWYDGAGRELKYRQMSWDKTNSVYNENYKFIHEYNGSGQKVLDSNFANGTLSNTHKFYYDGMGRLSIDSSFGSSNGVTIYTGKTDYTYDANGNLVQTDIHYWDKNNNVSVHRYKNYSYYNSYNQLTKQDGEQWNNSGWEKSLSYRLLYYEMPNSVKDATATKEAIALYPIPATTYTNLEMNFDKPTNFSVIVFDMQGRTVKQFTDKAEGHYKKNIIVQDMPAGQYMLQVKMNSDAISKNFTVIR